MKIHLIIPRPPVHAGGFTIQSDAPLRFTLRLSTDHPASHHGLGVLLTKERNILDGHFFRFLRDTIGARIETTNPAAICAALGLPKGEAGITQK